ncbi:MAG TPA: NAD(P)-dependent alcohol dehydrogenase [Candidatus Binatia bacterium]|nr:NAD(P)-dependent alcohol dehydrogenase [Candidatus Binatia bacterium]
MKAYVRDRYGSPDVLRLEEVDKPELTDGGALVRVRATSINAHDWHMLRGKPYIARLDEGLRRPKSTILGLDVAGVVEAVGANVTDLKPGDEVFGSRSGAFAEYVSGRNLVKMPAGLTFEQAAAVSVAGQTALQGLRDKGGLQAGQRVLVNGAGGGVGTFAVQIAKALGADVTAVTSTRNVDLALSIGANHVVDYTRDDFTRGGQRYDLILDIGGNRRLPSMRRALTPEGTVVLVAPQPGQWIGPVVRVIGALLTSRIGRQRVQPFLSAVSRGDLLVLRELIEAGKVTPVIDRTYPFAELPEAIRHVEAGHARGKVVVTL